jgi:hypothetical protein
MITRSRDISYRKILDWNSTAIEQIVIVKNAYKFIKFCQELALKFRRTIVEEFYEHYSRSLSSIYHHDRIIRLVYL